MRPRRPRAPASPEQRAKLSARATAQHAARRGYAIAPERRGEYHRAYLFLTASRGLSPEAAWQQLRSEYAEG